MDCIGLGLGLKTLTSYELFFKKKRKEKPDVLPYPSALCVALVVSSMLHSCTLFTHQGLICLAVNFPRHAVLQAEFRLLWCVRRRYSG